MVHLPSLFFAFSAAFLGARALSPRMQKEKLRRSRLKQVKTAQPTPVNTADNTPKAFAILFQIESAVATSRVWQSWLEDAYKWIHQSGLEGWEISANDSKILRTFVHHDFYFQPTFIQTNLPPLLRDSLVPKPLPCRWGPTNPCLYRLLEHSLQACPDCGYFTIVSNNHLPLKPFKFMYQQYLNDSRARLRISYLAFGQKEPYIPKMSAWKAIPREWAEVVVRDWKLWLPGSWTSDTDVGFVAAPDEWQILVPIYKEYGERMFNMISVGNVSQDEEPDLRAEHMRDCWDDKCCVGCKKASRHVPHMYTVLGEKSLKAWIDDPILWFFRKVTDKTTVEFEEKWKSEAVYSYIERVFLNSSSSSWRNDEKGGFSHLRVPEVKKRSLPWKTIVESLPEHAAYLSHEEAGALIDVEKCGE